MFTVLNIGDVNVRGIAGGGQVLAVGNFPDSTAPRPADYPTDAELATGIFNCNADFSGAVVFDVVAGSFGPVAANVRAGW